MREPGSKENNGTFAAGKKFYRRAGMVKGWFRGGSRTACNEFIKAMLDDNVRMMNAFMNKVALNTFRSFDSGNKPSEETEPERFYHGFVLGMVVNLADRYRIRSNRESGVFPGFSWRVWVAAGRRHVGL